ncbi:hypothetical protein FACS1894204_10750 [Synergistales bacterium]|nr:hypothetical protein FACS1894204_10750 [Synergistales bacterium]
MSSSTEKRRTEFVERVVRSLEAGIVPWQKKDLPVTPVQGAVSGRSYEGLNAFYLFEKCAENGYTDPRFITASEANKNGLFIRKGEHGVLLENWKQVVESADSKPSVRGYTVFNVEQLNGQLPTPKLGTEPNAEIDIPPGSSVKECRDAIKSKVAETVDGLGFRYTQDLIALRCNIASTMLMHEFRIPVEQTEGVPTKSWANSIKYDPSQLFKATRDGSLVAKTIISVMKESRECNGSYDNHDSHDNHDGQHDYDNHDEQLFQANQERSEAQRGQELISEANTIPRGLDSNLQSADLSATQESVISSSAKAASQVNDLRAFASSREASVANTVNTANTVNMTNATNITNTTNTTNTRTYAIAEARGVAKKQLGDNAIVTSAQPGRAYQGKIIGILGNTPDRAAIQAISDNHAILHDIRNISDKSNIEVGTDMNFTTDEQGYSEVQNVNTAKNSKKAEHEREGHKR